MFARLTQFAVIALVLGIAGQAKAAPLTYGTYYDESVFVSCNSAFFCRVSFSQTPANKLLMVKKISCSSSSSTQLSQGFLQIGTIFGGNPVPRYVPLALPAPAFINGAYYTNFREDTHFLIGRGRFPYVEVQNGLGTPTNYSINCTLIGDLMAPSE